MIVRQVSKETRMGDFIFHVTASSLPWGMSTGVSCNYIHHRSMEFILLILASLSTSIIKGRKEAPSTSDYKILRTTMCYLKILSILSNIWLSPPSFFAEIICKTKCVCFVFYQLSNSKSIRDKPKLNRP